MTDPADNTTRLREIEARLETATPWYGYDDHPQAKRRAEADIRYLLDRVRELEAERATLLAGLLAVQAFSRNERVHEIIDAALPAPETVETQG
jgi:hypothetical protein